MTCPFPAHQAVSSGVAAPLVLAITGVAWLTSIGCGGRDIPLVIDARAYRDLEVRLHVLLVPESVTCEGLALGDTTIENAMTGEVDRVSFRAGAEEIIEGLDRKRWTVFLAEAIDVLGTRAALGCAELDPTLEAIAIELEPVVIAETPAGPRLDIDGQGKSQPIDIGLHDASGKLLPSVPARYTIVSGEGRTTPKMLSSDSEGRITFAPELPDATGPLQVDLRVRWRLEGPLLFSAFRRPPVEFWCLPPEGPGIAFGRFGGAGLLGVARLTVRATGSRTRDLALEFCRFGRVPGEELFCPGGAISWSIEGDPTKLLVLENEPHEDDRVLVITTAGWWEVGTDRVRLPWPQGPASATLTAGGPCPRTVEVLSFDGVSYRAFRQTGEVPAAPLRGTLLTSGCVSASDGGWVRTYVTQARPEEGGGAFLVAHDLERGVVSPIPWNGPPTGFGFSRPLGNDPALLLGTQFALSDVVTTRAIFDRKAAALPLTLIGFDILPALPITVASGDLDGDRRSDVGALLVSSDPMTQALHFTLWSALGEREGRPRISGAVGIDDLSIAVPALGFGDIDGDEDSDFVLFGNGSRPSCPTPAHLIMLRSE